MGHLVGVLLTGHKMLQFESIVELIENTNLVIW
jgi:hypothetical protein